MDLTIKTTKDLRDEILRLETLEVEQRVVLKGRFSTPSAIFSTFFTMFSNNVTEDRKAAGVFKQDFIGLLSRFILPLALNKTLFRHSNFLVKAVVGILSQKASNYINGDAVTSVWDKAKSVVESFDPKKPGGILNTVRSIFTSKKPRAVIINHPTRIPSQQNLLKSGI
jgi:hypothetical protein